MWWSWYARGSVDADTSGNVGDQGKRVALESLDLGLEDHHDVPGVDLGHGLHRPKDVEVNSIGLILG